MELDLLLQQLPENFHHEVIQSGEGTSKIIIRCNCSNEEDFRKWLCEYEKLSHTSWIVRRTYKPDGRYLNFRKDFVCRLSNFKHVDKKSNPRSLARNCNASIVFKVKGDSSGARRNDSYLQVRFYISFWI
jgi:hypothetical protein